jgi:hypothetical protein
VPAQVSAQTRLFEPRSVAPYKAASIPAGRRTPDDLHEPRYEPELGKVIEQVLDVEAPMHIDLLARRVGAYFGIGRVTTRVSDRIREVTSARARLGDTTDTDAVWRSDQDPSSLPSVRAADAENRREPDEIPLAEVAAAAALVLDRNLGMPVDDLARETARLLGFARLGDKAKKRMRAGIDVLAARGGCTIDGTHAALPA